MNKNQVITGKTFIGYVYWAVCGVALCCACQSSGYPEITPPEEEPKEDVKTYEWPKYEPEISYDFRDEYKDLKEPTKDLDDCEGVVGTISSGWWTFKWGANANHLVTEAAVRPMLDRLNKDFAYFRDVMGWPPDKRARNGYRSAVYLYGSGLCTDNASNTDLGGWMGTIYHKDEPWHMVLISYYPVYCFDPQCNYSDKDYQTGAVVHEGIHSVLSGLPGCKDAGWLHEGGDTWLQQEADAMRSGNYSEMGFLNGTSFLAPFLPIECYSGWLLDGSFGGPNAEGVDMYENGQKICTVRNYLGGTQYSSVFPIFLSQTLGMKSVAWVWRYCEKRVLEGLAAKLGDSQTRRLIVEYRAKQALIDMGKWTEAARKVVNEHFGTEIKEEVEPAWYNVPEWNATPYAKTTLNDAGELIPEGRTTPGWSGANQIPLHVKGDEVVIDFQPLGTNMSCQLCYRTGGGDVVYGEPVTSGECRITLQKKPANGVIFAVICNTDYVYKGEETRKAHFNYKIKPGTGVVRTADINKKWYNWGETIVD